MPERIFVVGHAAVTCLGRDMDSTWRGLVEGRSGVRRHPELASEAFLQDLGGMVEGLGPGTDAEDPAIAKLSARFLHLAMAAAREACADSGLLRMEERVDPDRVAVVVGSAFGGLDLLSAEAGTDEPPAQSGGQPLSGAGDDHQSGSRADRAAPAAVWAQRRAGECVCFGRARGGSGRDVSALGRSRRGGLRRGRECFHAGGDQRFRDDEGAIGAQGGRSIGRRSGPGKPAVQPGPGGIRAGGRGWGPGPGDRVGRGADGAGAAGRAAGLGDEFRRLPHGDALPGTDRQVSARPRSSKRG